MKVRDFIEVMNSTKITMLCKTFEGSKIIDEKEETFEIYDVGFGSFIGSFYCNTIVFKKDGKEIKTFETFARLNAYKEYLDMELVSVEKINLNHYFKKSSTGNLYYDNGSNVTFVVK